jgi:hypothetical protein
MVVGLGNFRELTRPDHGGHSNLADFFRLESFWALNERELDPLTFVQRSVAIALYRSEVNKDVFVAVRGGDKAEPLGVIEPLDGALLFVGHNLTPDYCF